MVRAARFLDVAGPRRKKEKKKRSFFGPAATQFAVGRRRSANLAGKLGTTVL